MQLSLHLTNFIQLWEYIAEKSLLILGILRPLDPQTSQSKDQVKNLKLKFNQRNHYLRPKLDFLPFLNWSSILLSSSLSIWLILNKLISIDFLAFLSQAEIISLQNQLLFQSFKFLWFLFLSFRLILDHFLMRSNAELIRFELVLFCICFSFQFLELSVIHPRWLKWLFIYFWDA